jgi:hypothetical protein
MLDHRSHVRAVKPLTIAALLALLGIAALGGCGSGDPFGYATVSGKVTYDDGSPIPAEMITLTFYPEADPLDAKTYPRSGKAYVEKQTGEFRSATTMKVGDGIVRGKHKVTVTGRGREPLPESVVPAEYANSSKTPLEVDTATRPFVLKVRKPGAKSNP